MKILFDTSVIIAAMVEPHPFHPIAFPWLKRARSKEFDLFIASHTLAELYAVLTTLPIRPRIAPGVARQLIHNNLESIARVVSLSASDYRSVIKRMGDLELSGGIIYDALIVRAAQRSRVDRIVTFNMDDFKRVWPEGTAHITAP
jgi:predicted nucleic acid-binding protein